MIEEKEVKMVMKKVLILAVVMVLLMSLFAVRAYADTQTAETESEGLSFVAVASMQVADFVEMTEAEAQEAGHGTWSLASLIFGLMSVLLTVFTLTAKNVSRILKAAALILAGVTAAIILTNTDMSGAMVTVDRGSLAVVILNIFEAVFASTASNEVRLG